ncbi:MAG TPA: amino acid ABC transporter substrate-binding protein, partial [Pilimelia sp.]|nr:amino acid ABC transporter substrate-binding protein [Pilimelia sp.]
MLKTTRVRAALAVLTAVSLGLGACSKDEEPAKTASGPIKIGISLPLTGDFSEPGKGIREGYELWAEQVNAAGGMLGRQVELIFRDDASDPNRVVTDYESLITQDKVNLVFGPFSSRLVIPAAEVAESYDMLFVEPAGAAPDVFKQGFKYLFYAAPAVANDHYNYLAEYILALPPDQRPKTAAYASLDDPFAKGTAYGLRDKLAAGGIKTVADEVYPPENTDFGAIAARIASKKADMFVGGTQFEDSVGMVRALQELKVQFKIAAFSTGPTLPEFPEAVGKASEGILSPVGWAVNATYPGNKEFVEAHKKKFGREPSEDQANGYTVGQVVKAAVDA